MDNPGWIPAPTSSPSQALRQMANARRDGPDRDRLLILAAHARDHEHGHDTASEVEQMFADAGYRTDAEHGLPDLAQIVLTQLSELAALLAQVEEALRAIRDYGTEGPRTQGGYPSEVTHDLYAYERIVDSYREAARAALALVEGEQA